MNTIFWKYDEKYELDGSYEEFVNAPDEELNWLVIDEVLKVIKEIKNKDLQTRMIERLVTYFINSSFIDIDRYLDPSIFTKEQIEKINSRIIEEIKNIIGNYNYTYRITNYLFSTRKREEIIRKANILFELINNSEKVTNKEEDNTKLLFDIKRVDKKAFEEIYGYFKYPYKKELDEYLKMQTDPKYISRRIPKYEDKRIGIDPNISIGLEIEINSKYSLEPNLYGQDEYHTYRTGTDATVPDGFEFDTSIIHDGKDIPALYAFCESMQNIGLYKNRESNNIGGQINLGLDYLDTKESFRNFVEIFANVEEILFYISNEKGEIIRQSIYESSRFKPISKLLGTLIIDEDLTREDLIKMFYARGTTDNKLGLTYKTNTFCVRDIEDKNKSRIEIRIPNGTINPDVWVDNIRLYGRMFEISKQIEEIRKKDYLTEREEKILYIKEELKEEHTLEEKLMLLMDLLFEDEKTKEIYIERYKETLKQIILTGTDRYREDYYSTNGFDNVELIDQYYTDSDKHVVIEYDPETEEYKESGPRL